MARMRKNLLILLAVAVGTIGLLAIAGYFLMRRSKTKSSKSIKIGEGVIEGDTAEKLVESASSALSSHKSYGPAVSTNVSSGYNRNITSVATSIWKELGGKTTGNAKVDAHIENIIKAAQIGSQNLNEQLKSLSKSDTEEVMSAILDMISESPTVKQNFCFGWRKANAVPSQSTDLLWSFAFLVQKNASSTFQQNINAYLNSEQTDKKLVAYPVFCFGYIQGGTRGVVLNERIKVQDKEYLLKGVLLAGGGSNYEFSMLLVKNDQDYWRVDLEPEKKVDFREVCSHHPIAFTFYEIY